MRQVTGRDASHFAEAAIQPAIWVKPKRPFHCLEGDLADQLFASIVRNADLSMASIPVALQKEFGKVLLVELIFLSRPCGVRLAFLTRLATYPNCVVAKEERCNPMYVC